MSDDIEIDIELPDDDGDVDNDGVPDAVETGVALERATNADENADFAIAQAEEATAVAGIGAEIAYAAETRVAELERINAEQSARIDALTNTVAGLVTITENLANVAIADLESEQFEELPQDETPPNKHWLNRPIFGGK